VRVSPARLILPALVGVCTSVFWLIWTAPRVGFTLVFLPEMPERYQCIPALSHVSLYGSWYIKAVNESQSESIRFQKVVVVPFAREGGLHLTIDVDENRPQFTKTGSLVSKHTDVSIPPSEFKELRQDGAMPHVSSKSREFIRRSNQCASPMSWIGWVAQPFGKALQPDTLTLNVVLASGEEFALSAKIDDSRPNHWMVKPQTIVKLPFFQTMIFDASSLYKRFISYR
jgi:hypothetical protein